MFFPLSLIIVVGTILCTSGSTAQIVVLYAYSEIENITGAQDTCGELARQYLVLADLRIIQAIQHILEKNNTGVSDQLLVATKLLNEASEALWCE
jgi:hypothetical protein